MTDEEARFLAAVTCFLDRESCAAHPDGKQDPGGRWWPSPTEEQDCCQDIRINAAYYQR